MWISLSMDYIGILCMYLACITLICDCIEIICKYEVSWNIQFKRGEYIAWPPNPSEIMPPHCVLIFILSKSCSDPCNE